MQTCRICQFQSKLQKNNELYPIPIGELQKQIEIDIVRSFLIIEKENRYIIIYIDYMIKWAEMKLLSDKLAVQVM